MTSTTQAQAYQRNLVQHASPVEVVVMLYDKAIRCLKTAAAAMTKQEIAEKGKAICLAVDIITELQSVLDKERGGEIAVKLNQLYTYMLERLTVGHYVNDPKSLAEVAGLLEELQQGWRGLVQSSAALQAGAARPAEPVLVGAGTRVTYQRPQMAAATTMALKA